MKRFSIILLIFAVLSCACNKPGGGSSTNTDQPETEKPEERPYRLTVDGKPFLMLGSQLRMDFFKYLDHKNLDELDKYFELAASLNITVVQLAFCWSDVETDYDVYTDETIKAYIDYCRSYDLKAEFLWFGSFMCGYSVEYYMPSYITKDEETYLRFPVGGWDGWEGWTYYLRPGSTALLERETKAIGKMMEFIDAYDRELGRPHTVIGIQVENEPDMLPNRHYGVLGKSSSDLWPSMLHHLETMGRVVKQSPYKCYTRVNFTLDEGYVKWSQQVFRRGGIDYIGLDPYVADVNKIGELLTFLGSMEGNFPHIAENGGEFYNNDILTLKALSMGGGYEVFEVVTTPDPQLKDWTLRGVYNPDFTPKGQTQRLIDAYAIFKGAWYDFATAPVENIHGFNLQRSEGSDNTSESVSLDGSGLTWTTSARGVAFAIEGPEYITLASTKSDLFEFDRTPSSAETGHYNSAGDWISGGQVAIGASFRAQAGKIYRIKL